MARSPAHKFGQLIGDLLEAALRGPLRTIAAEHRLYLDYKHPRPARAGKRKVAWRDHRGNEHDLDYVLEEGGSEETTGRPRAFIEIAWRRYTKHSRNKTQEIQGAIAPLAETHAGTHPFLGAVLAGVFTAGSIKQLRSHSFQVLYFPYASVVAAFRAVGINAQFEESTSDSRLQRKVDACNRLSSARKQLVIDALISARRKELDMFLDALRRTLARSVRSVRVIPLHGIAQVLASVDEAVDFIRGFNEAKPGREFVRYEVMVCYNNGDEVRGEFKDKNAAIAFLGTMTQPRRVAPEDAGLI